MLQGECCLLLHNIVLQKHVVDKWQWLLDLVKGYSVISVYQLLTIVEELAHQFFIDNIWHKQVPLKVYLFVWRLHHNRLSTKDNLMHRGIIQPSSNKCVSVSGFVVWRK